MAGIIKMNLNLDNIPKDKIYKGKKGKYLTVVVTVNDDVDQFGNQGPVYVDQNKEEREAKEPKTYLGNVKVVWTNGDFPEPAPKEEKEHTEMRQAVSNAVDEEDLPF